MVWGQGPWGFERLGLLGKAGGGCSLVGDRPHGLSGQEVQQLELLAQALPLGPGEVVPGLSANMVHLLLSSHGQDGTTVSPFLEKMLLGHLSTMAPLFKDIPGGSFIWAPPV